MRQACLVHAHSLRDSDPPARSTRNTRVRKAYTCCHTHTHTHTHIYICFKLCMCAMFHRSPNERHTQPAPPPSPSKVLLDANFLLWISYDSMLVSIYYYFSLSVPQKEDGMLPKSCAHTHTHTHTRIPTWCRSLCSPKACMTNSCLTGGSAL